MNNCQIQVTDIQRLINEMRVMYGKKFTDQWASVGETELEQGFFKRLSDLTKEQIATGYKRMNSEAWPPSIPEFRNWCTQGSNWLTEHEAWLQALAYEKSNETKSISVFVKHALDQLKGAYTEIRPNSETQAKAFKDSYVRLVSEAKAQGAVQTFTQAKTLLDAPKNDDHKAVACPDHLIKQLRGVNKNKGVGYEF